MAKRHAWICLLVGLESAAMPAVATADDNPSAAGFDHAGSDSSAIALADQVMSRLGGYKNWDHTRYITWRFFGNRLHVWDKWTGRIRFEQGGLTVLMNVIDKNGRAWQSGVEVTTADSLGTLLESGHRAWINDSYWMFMPYKLKDSGVTLKHVGAGTTTDGVEAEIVELTFSGVGVTPQNKYHVYIGGGSKRVVQWDFFADVADTKPRFQIPWTNWLPHGRIWLSDDRGKRKHSEIAVFDVLPATVFSDPTPVDMMAFERATVP
jgi:hypothetical protein